LYKDFRSFNVKLDDRKNRVVMLTGNTDLTYNANPDNLGEISRMCGMAGVNPDRITSAQNEKGQVWSIGFNAYFASLTNCLHNLETNYRVDSLTVVKGTRGPAHAVEISISSIVPDPADSAGAATASKGGSTEIFDIYDQASVLIESIEKKADERNRNEMPRDPFAEEVRPVEQKAVVTVKVKATVVEEQLPNVALEAISWDPETPVAIVDGRACREGDTVRDGDVRITKIHENSIVVEWHSRQFTLKLK
jgi:hypothetical protein